MSRRKSADHVVFDNRGNAAEPVGLCLHCGETYPIHLPCSLGMFAAICKEFVSEHRHCKKKEGTELTAPVPPVTTPPTP